MLDTTFTIPFDNPQAYDLKMRKCSSWDSTKKRILIVVQTVDSRDLRAKVLMGDKLTKTTMHNCIKYARGIARTYTDKGIDNTAFAVVNFHQYKHLHLPSGPRRAAEADFAKHVHGIIRKLKPTHVLISGDNAMAAMFPQIEKSNYKRGWVHELSSGDVKLKVVSTLDMARLLEKQGQHANLLGFWCRHMCNLMINHMPHNLSPVKAKPKYINSIEAFDKTMALLYKSKIVAVDTETSNLSVLHNAIYTIQFTSDRLPDIGFIVPYKHPRTPWTKDELRHIRKELTKFFRYKSGPELVTFNGMFDLRIIRRQFKIPIIWNRIWEITAGEHDLDENISGLSTFGAKPGGLAAVYCSYGNDFYYTAAFSKDERATIASINVNKNKDFHMYASTDTVSILAIRQAQIDKADHQFIEDHKYGGYFKRHVLYQMSDTAHQLSHLREDGSYVDAKYLRHLISADSPLRKELKTLDKDMRNFPDMQEANKQLLDASGLKSKGLFGAARQATNWVLRVSKPDHLRILFFDIMKLEPVSETKGGLPSTDKNFVAEYKDNNLVIDAYGQYAALGKLLSTYAKGWYKKLTTSKDSVTDGHLRPDYSFFDVDTGRLACKNPNLQTIPTRSKLAKMIKRMFVAPPDALLVRFDYSAHEVRVWSIISGDKVLAEVFRMGQKLRQIFIKDPSDKNRKDIKEKGDVHILNVKRLFNKMVDKSHPLRDAVKGVIFGLLYGKSTQTLGIDTKKGDIDTSKAKLNALRKELKQLESASV